MRIAAHRKAQSIPKLVNSQPRPRLRAFFYPNTVFPHPGIVRFTKESAGCESPVNSQQKRDKIFKKSAQHLEIKRPSMAGTLPRGVPSGKNSQQRKKKKKKGQKGCNTRTSQEVTHPSTTLAQARLTAGSDGIRCISAGMIAPIHSP